MNIIDVLPQYYYTPSRIVLKQLIKGAEGPARSGSFLWLAMEAFTSRVSTSVVIC